MKNVWNIRRIENLTEAEAAKMAIEKMTVKNDYNCYFIDFGGYFGYSVCVFADGQHLKYANDYELHHRGKSREELRDLYIKKLNKALYTIDELEIVQNYDDFTSKDYFIRNYYSMRRPRLSAFQIFHSDEEEKAFDAETKKMTFSSVGMAYYDDADFVRHLSALSERLNAAKAAHDNDRAYWESAFQSEMYNHEYFNACNTLISQLTEYYNHGFSDNADKYVVIGTQIYRKTPYLLLSIIAVVSAIIGTLILALRNKKIKLATNSNDYFDNKSFEITKDTKEFISSNTSRVYIPPADSGGGGSSGGGFHSGSSGASHGGGGHRF